MSLPFFPGRAVIIGLTNNSPHLYFKPHRFSLSIDLNYCNILLTNIFASGLSPHSPFLLHASARLIFLSDQPDNLTLLIKKLQQPSTVYYIKFIFFRPSREACWALVSTPSPSLSCPPGPTLSTPGPHTKRPPLADQSSVNL